MKKLNLLFIALVFSAFIAAQKPVIVFEKNNHDFGKIDEEGGKATYIFVFTNKGNAPMVVSRVQASCGCTTPIWTKEPIGPGKKGTIEVTYNPLGRPGAFTKSITVYSNATEEQVTLIIRGDVIPKSTAQSSESHLPVAINDLRLSAKAVQFNNIEKGRTLQRTVEIQNSGSNPIRVMVENLPAHITANISPDVLKPKDEGKITFTFNSTQTNLWGPINNDAYIVINGQRKFTEENALKFYSNIIEDFGKLTPDQRRKAPIVETPTRSVAFGDLKAGSKKNAKFRISNKGLSTLEVRRIINNNREVKVDQSKLSVHSGKSGFLSFNLDTKNLPEGDYKKPITIQTNDPDNSILIVVLNWKVKS